MSSKTLVRAALFCLLAAAGVVEARAGEAHLYLAPYLFDSSLTGNALVSGGKTGTDFDLEDTLGLDPDEKVRGIEGFAKFFGSRIEFGYNQGTYKGGRKLTDDLVFDGTTYSTGETVRPEIDLKRYKLMYGYDFGLKVVNAGFLIGGYYIDLDAKLRSSAGFSESARLSAPVPGIGATLGIHPVSQLAIHAEISGFHANMWGYETTLLDAFAGIDYLFVPKFGISAGYRYFALDAKDDDEGNMVDVKQRGPFVALALHL